jgi:hypothetical protein
MGTASSKKFIKNASGALAEEAALTTSAGAADANAIPALNANGVLDLTIVNAKVVSAGAGDSGKLPALDGTGRLDNSVMPVGIGADVVTLTASEALSAGNFINIYNNGGTPSMRKADATTAGKHAQGFVLAAVSSGATGTAYLSGQNTAVTGQVAGDVFLATTAGAATATAPSASGNVVQNLGVAVSATSIEFKPQRPITLA